jgi:hypothetical protein
MKPKDQIQLESCRAHIYRQALRNDPELQDMVVVRVAHWGLKQDVLKELGITLTDLVLLWQSMRPHSGLQE